MGIAGGGGDGFKERVREATDIAEVIGAFTPLRPAGPGRFSGLCPFHAETSPSFQVDARRGFFHCFGCKKSGDVFSFLMEKEGLSFREALERLAGHAGIPVPRRSPRRARLKDRLRAAADMALAHFRKTLIGRGGAEARAYLRGRGLSGAMLAEHGLGFAASAWDDLFRALARAGVSERVMLEAGLVRERPGGGHYDFFRDRLILPIHDGQGRVIGFAGRTLGSEEPKYVNGPDSPIYQKRHVLYGWHHARPAIRAERSAVLFEGYFDCLSAWQAGIAPAAAVCGTALTEHHARQLKAQTGEVVLAFDGDKGGRRATRRSLPVLLAAGLSVRVVRVPAGRDPDDVIREDGGSTFRELIRRAPGFVPFLVEEAERRRDLPGVGGRAGAAREVFTVIAAAPGALEREVWLEEAAGPLGFSLDSALEELRRLRRRGAPSAFRRRAGAQAAKSESPPPPPARFTEAERDLVRWAEQEPSAAARILREAAAEVFSGLVSEGLLLTMKEAAEQGAVSAAGLIGPVRSGEGEDSRLMQRMLAEPVPLHHDQSPQDCLDALRLRSLRAKMPRLRAALATAGPDIDEALRRFQETGQEINRLQQGQRPDAGGRARSGHGPEEHAAPAP